MKMSAAENFCGFCGFSLDCKLWPCRSAIQQNFYSESFTTNSYIPLKMRKIPPTDVYPYTRYILNTVNAMVNLK